MLQQLQQQYQRSRLQEFYNGHLTREMMLKLNVRSVQQLPRIRSIDLSVSSKDLHGKRYVSARVCGRGGNSLKQLDTRK